MTVTKSSSKRGQSLAFHVQLNRDICSVSDKGGIHAVQALLDLIQAKHTKMNLVNLSTALHRLARVAMEDEHMPVFTKDQRMELLRSRLSQEIGACDSAKDARTNARCLSTIAWAYGRLQMDDPAMMQSIGDLAKHWLTSFKEFELTNLLWGFAKLQAVHLPLFEAASQHVLDHLKEFTPANLSMIAWAFATAKFRPCRKLLLTLGSTFAQKLASPEGIKEHASPVVIENMIWALATAGVRAKPEILEVIGDAAVAVIRNFKAHELAITLWAFARLESWHGKLFSEAACLLCSNNNTMRNQLHTQAVTNVLWAYAKQFPSQSGAAHQMTTMKLLSNLLPVVQRLLVHMKPMEISASLSSVLTLAQRWGAVPIADGFVHQVSELILSMQGVPLEFAQHSAVNMLAAFTKFFADTKAPPACSALMAQLAASCEAHKQRTASAGPDTAGSASDECDSVETWQSLDSAVSTSKEVQPMYPPGLEQLASKPAQLHSQRAQQNLLQRQQQQQEQQVQQQQQQHVQHQHVQQKQHVQKQSQQLLMLLQQQQHLLNQNTSAKEPVYVTPQSSLLRSTTTPETLLACTPGQPMYLPVPSDLATEASRSPTVCTKSYVPLARIEVLEEHSTLFNQSQQPNTPVVIAFRIRCEHVLEGICVKADNVVDGELACSVQLPIRVTDASQVHTVSVPYTGIGQQVDMTLSSMNSLGFKGAADHSLMLRNLGGKAASPSSSSSTRASSSEDGNSSGTEGGRTSDSVIEKKSSRASRGKLNGTSRSTIPSQSHIYD